MPRTVQIAASLPAPPERLFNMYLDPVEHAGFTGFPVTIGREPGHVFNAFEGKLSGFILQVVPSRLIVQSWRSSKWPGEAIDSTLILTFWEQAGGGRIELTHVNVADEDYADVCHGWQSYYWTPWREYLEAR